MDRRILIALVAGIMLAGCVTNGGSNQDGNGSTDKVKVRGLVIAEAKVTEDSITTDEGTTFTLKIRNTNPTAVTGIGLQFSNTLGATPQLQTQTPTCQSIDSGSGRLRGVTPAGNVDAVSCAWRIDGSSISLSSESQTVPMSYVLSYSSSLSMASDSLKVTLGADESSGVRDRTFSNGELSLTTTHRPRWTSTAKIPVKLTVSNIGSGQIATDSQGRRKVTYELSGSLLQDAGFSEEPVQSASYTTCDRTVFAPGSQSATSTCILTRRSQYRGGLSTYTLRIDVNYDYRKYGQAAFTLTRAP